MNIYIKIEILDRELEGRLLLAMVAAERGHDVLLGTMNALLSHRLWLTPGIYHDKSLTPKPGKVSLHRRLVDAGFVVSSQDEESGLKQPDYAPFARRRFSSETLSTASAVLTWGPHDTSALLAAYPDHRGQFHMTGSPRVDLWRRELRGLHSAATDRLLLSGLDAGRPVVLIAPGSIPFRPNDFWTMIQDARPRQFRGDDDPREWSHYTSHATAFAYAGRLVRAVRLAARELPHVQFVIRPHPKSAEGAWEAVLGPVPENVIVTREGSSGRWLAVADVLIHNGSTTGAEAAAGGVSVISFQPHGEGVELFTNRVGEIAHDEEHLVALLRSSTGQGDRRGMDVATLEVLGGRFASLEGRLAADRIVDVWDQFDAPPLTRRNRVATARMMAEAHQLLGAVRASILATGTAHRHQPVLDVRSKFPPLRRPEVMRISDGLRRTLDRFSEIEVELVSPHLLRVRNRRAGQR